MDKNIRLLKESINRMVEKAFKENVNQEDKIDSLVENIVKEQLQKIYEAKPKRKESSKKHAVLQWLRQPEVNSAEIRRQVEGEPETQEEEDSKRSYFMKKVNQTNGKSFNTKEINDLYAVKNSLGQ